MQPQNQPSNYHPHAIDLAKLVAQNPNVSAAWLDTDDQAALLHICLTEPTAPRNFICPTPLIHLKQKYHPPLTFKTLEAPLTPIDPRNEHQHCQNEPVELGTQIQPAGANWLGTAGSPIRWKDASETMRWGFLSNWHVMVTDPAPQATRQHQPSTAFPHIGYLYGASPVSPDAINTIDAAVASAKVDGYHTISDRILGIGPLLRAPISATVGLIVQKSGRTTKLTHARCTAIGAALKVRYGNFIATFQDQDIYTQIDEPFSGPGDSGSLIVTEANPAPVSLLFAGGGDMTIGNPFRHVAHRFNILHPFT